MNLVKVGNRVINLAMVVEATQKYGEVLLYIATPGQTDATPRIEAQFQAMTVIKFPPGSEADALWEYIKGKADTVA